MQKQVSFSLVTGIKYDVPSERDVFGLSKFLEKNSLIEELIFNHNDQN